MDMEQNICIYIHCNFFERMWCLPYGDTLVYIVAYLMQALVYALHYDVHALCHIHPFFISNINLCVYFTICALSLVLYTHAHPIFAFQVHSWLFAHVLTCTYFYTCFYFLNTNMGIHLTLFYAIFTYILNLQYNKVMNFGISFIFIQTHPIPK